MADALTALTAYAPVAGILLSWAGASAGVIKAILFGS